ncbi:MAG: T9SS type A sorting domain-containing protein [Crocinitomicaceae bacterium]|nr:T9SS type A sorting domain-containing protein [Crocinitomicaceae bacterium]
MKKILFLTTFFVSFFCQSQTNDYFQNGAKWRINRTGISMVASCGMMQFYVCEIAGDTTIGAHTYKKFIQHGLATELGIMGYMGPCAPDSTFTQHYAFLRQENERIYIYDRLDQIDTLLYDFDLQVGDFLPLTYNNLSSDIQIDNITTIQVGTETRNVFHFNQGNGIDSLIEGIGHNKGLIGTMQPFEFFEYELMCFSLDGTSYYPSLGAACDLTVSTLEINQTTSSQISPNPVIDFAQISFSNPVNIAEVLAIDLTGRKVMLPYKSVNENTIEIDSRELIKGHYIINYQLDNKQNLTGKFLK